MKSWLPQALDLLGLSAPVVYAAATYSIFHFLDRSASGQAKQAISAWFTRRYDKAAVALATVEVFDRLYARPLLGWRAFFRSALFSLLVAGIFGYEVFGTQYFFNVHYYDNTKELTAIQISVNVLSDYLSLFLIRKWLIISGQRPLTALLIGPIVGALVILAFYSLIYAWDDYRFGHLFDSRPTFLAAVAGLFAGQLIMPATLLIPPALAVHLWLPLFALGVLFAQILNSLLSAASFVQWFIKRGRDHPLRAIGWVAAALVMVGVEIARLLL